jgi:hypothetical protein
MALIEINSGTWIEPARVGAIKSSGTGAVVYVDGKAFSSAMSVEKLINLLRQRNQKNFEQQLYT